MYYSGIATMTAHHQTGNNRTKHFQEPHQILDMMGRETSFKTNTAYLYATDDGSIEGV